MSWIDEMGMICRFCAIAAAFATPAFAAFSNSASYMIYGRKHDKYPAAYDKSMKFSILSTIFMICAAAGGQLSFVEPAPGRDAGRIYYYVPDGVDLARPAPLFIFLHGGDRNSPDTAPSRYLDEEKGWLMPVMRSAPFVVAAPSAPPAVDGSRWNRDGVSRCIDATIEAAAKRFKIDRDRIFLGGHSMGGFGAYHLGQILADRFAGVWLSAGGWWEADFRAFLGTPVYMQHGARDCSPAPGYSGGHALPRRHHWCGVSFARAAHELMARDNVEHVYDEHAEGHSLSFPAAKAAMERFVAWTAGKRRDPYAKRTALITPCGTMHPDVERLSRSRWLELVEADYGEIAVDALVLKGPDIARTEADLEKQTYSLIKRYWDGASRIIAENAGANRFKVETENVKRFAILLAPAMGDMTRPFEVDLGDGLKVSCRAEPFTVNRDYTARLNIVVPAPDGKCNETKLRKQ